MASTGIKASRMMNWLEYRVRVNTEDGRVLVGTLLAFDKYLNLVLSDCEEFRQVRMKVDQKKNDPKKAAAANVYVERTVKKVLGLTLLRGEVVCGVTAEAPPAHAVAKKAMQPGPGRSAPVGRGSGVATTGGGSGLTGAVRGVGGPSGRDMMPRN